ncbi:MAG: hypothetical protein QOI04_1242 [Verrucomicrobiota bacterium]|jgi:hypothetical protein
MPQDYILRLIEQVALILAEISGLKNAEEPERIGAICQREIGLPLDFLKHSSPEKILQLLESGGGTQNARAVLLAELFLQDAELSDAAGRNRDSMISRAQAQALLAHSVGKLSPDEQAIYRPKLEALTADLKRDGP